MKKRQIKLSKKVFDVYKEISDLSGLPVEYVLTVFLALSAWREIKIKEGK